MFPTLLFVLDCTLTILSSFMISMFENKNNIRLFPFLIEVSIEILLNKIKFLIEIPKVRKSDGILLKTTEKKPDWRTKKIIPSMLMYF